VRDSKAMGFRWPDGRRAAVSLTWDDARPSQVDVGVPILNRYGIRGTFYLLPRNMRGRVAKWRAAAAQGHEIGNHSLRHPCTGNFVGWQTRATMLENYSLGRMERELLKANRILGAALGVRPTSFAYCCGQSFVGRGRRLRSYVPLVARLFVVGQAGYSETYASPERCDLAQVPSIKFDNKTFDELRVTVDAAVADGCWLILFGHEVGGARARQTTSAGALRRLCAHLRSRPEIWVDTVTAVGRHIGATVRHPPIRRRAR
jgi:peptidoglycan/xylan/chitin deacetylase (PgdA/CDA1 family)